MNGFLKIALVSPYDFASYGGANDHIRRLASQFRLWGHNVRIIAPCSAPGSIEDDDFTPMGRPVPFPSRGSIARVSLSPWMRPRVKELLDRWPQDVIHLHEPFAGFVTANLISLSQTVNIATFHAYPGSRIYDIGGKQLAMPYFKKLHGRIAVSKPARDYIKRYFPGEYEIIPNGIQVDDFAEAEPIQNLRDGMINLLFLGRLEKRKGLKYLMAAFSRLKWNWPNLRLIVVGPGNIDEDSLRVMSERNLHDVVVVGSVSDQEKVRYYKSADIYCSPATGGESFGVVLLEAMASGTPVVATNIEGYSGVITNGKNGLLATPMDDKSLADTIDILLRNHDVRAQLVDEGRRTAESYRWERVASRVLTYYEEIIEEQTTSRV
ncbi:MAG: glycosyltransferase family 4 protein [SAR202 cluster bacterium]|nr:glycosyltransferase family 4 protein [SAR202 cluster bacterium]